VQGDYIQAAEMTLDLPQTSIGARS
jgi:hypothetical protein